MGDSPVTGRHPKLRSKDGLLRSDAQFPAHIRTQTFHPADPLFKEHTMNTKTLIAAEETLIAVETQEQTQEVTAELSVLEMDLVGGGNAEALWV